MWDISGYSQISGFRCLLESNENGVEMHFEPDFFMFHDDIVSLCAVVSFLWCIFCLSQTWCLCMCMSELDFSNSEGQCPAPLYTAVLLLGCRFVEILLNVFVTHINGRLEHPSICKKMRTARFFSTTSAAISKDFFLSALQPGIICVTFNDWSAAHSLTNRCNCLRKNGHLSLQLEWA